MPDTARLRERGDLGRIALAAWCNVPVDRLPTDKPFAFYPNDSTVEAWARVYEAVRRQALEDAARRCEEHARAMRDDGEFYDATIADECVATIRAMMEEQP